MNPEALALNVARAVVIEVVQARFADPDDPGMPCYLDEALHRRDTLFRDIVRMNADRTPDTGITLRDREDPVERGEARTDRDHGSDPGFGGPHHDLVEIDRKSTRLNSSP